MTTTTLHPCIVAGRAVSTRETAGVLNPYTDQEIARICLAGDDEVEAAIAGAVTCFPELSRSSRAQRAEWLLAIADGIRCRAEEFTRLLVQEAGKPLRFARGEVSRAQNTFTVAAHEALRFAGEIVPVDAAAAGAGYIGYTRRVPAGPVIAITPFNFPMNLVAHKLAPALAVGAPVILKPASATPLCALKLAEVIGQSGAPAGYLSVLPMPGPRAEKLVSDRRMRILTFTGSDSVGWHLKGLDPRKKVLLELGGNAPVVVHSDADLDFAIPRIAIGGYAFAGQVCISVQRILVHRPIYDTFRDRYVAEVQGLGVGDPGLEDTVVGPLIRPKDLHRVADWVERARNEGAKILCGGKAEPPIYHPTVLDQVEPPMWVSCEEVFGPVTVLVPYDDFEQGLELANDPRYGLQAGVFTRDLGRVLDCHEQLDFGGIVVNDYPTFRVDQMPYGGVKDSGFGREGLRYSMEEMSEPRLLVINRNAS